MKRRSLSAPYRLPGERIDYVGITLGGSHHYRVVPLMPDMSWLGEPLSARMAQRYETARVIAHESAVRIERAELCRQADDLARELDCYDGTRREAMRAQLNALHERLGARCNCDSGFATREALELR